MRRRKILKLKGLFIVNIAKVYCYHYEFIVQKSFDLELVFVDVHEFLQSGVALIVIGIPKVSSNENWKKLDIFLHILCFRILLK